MVRTLSGPEVGKYKQEFLLHPLSLIRVLGRVFTVEVVEYLDWICTGEGRFRARRRVLLAVDEMIDVLTPLRQFFIQDSLCVHLQH